MKNRYDIENYFLKILKWKRIFGLPGQFSFTPDGESSYMRVFSSDIVAGRYGRQLLGLVGIHFSDGNYPFHDRLGISTYILNLPPLNESFYILDQESMEIWINKISDVVLSLPANPHDLLQDFEEGRIGRFNIKNFEDSTCWSKEFFEWVRSMY